MLAVMSPRSTSIAITRWTSGSSRRYWTAASGIGAADWNTCCDRPAICVRYCAGFAGLSTIRASAAYDGTYMSWVSLNTCAALSYSVAGSSVVRLSSVPWIWAARVIWALRIRRLPSRMRTVGVLVDCASDSARSSSARSALSYCLAFT